MLSLGNSLADNQGIPMSISTQDEIDRLGLSLKWAMELDLERLTQLGRDDEVFLMLMQIAVFAVLSELDGMPLIAFLEAREPNFLLQCLESKKPLEGFGKAVCKALYRGGWDMLASASFETSGKIILARECTLVLILRFDRFKHLVIDVP